ncbi:MAG: hypothetical protein J7K68_02080 [Candidatus Diapherotrites archaeon]|nr:hypothetical protein [Candidatus Diapherotrites archaeon]
MKKILLVCLLLFSMAFAQPEVVKVGTYILNVGKYNIEEGSYTADFYLWFKWNGSIKPDTFEFMNGKPEHVELDIEEPGYLFYRVYGEFYETANLKNYPVDTQTLTIKVEDSVHTTDEVVYVPDDAEIGIDNELNVLGWDLKNSTYYVTGSYYPNWDENYSRYVHSITIARPESTLWKTLLPFFFIILSAWACFFLPLHKLGEKLALGGTALLSSVVFHLYLTEQIPPVGYVVLADEIAISMYAMLVFTIMAFIAVESLVIKKEMEKARKLNNWFKVISILVPVFVFALISLVS